MSMLNLSVPAQDLDMNSAIATHPSQNPADAHVRAIQVASYHAIDNLLATALQSFDKWGKACLSMTSSSLAMSNHSFAEQIEAAVRTAFNEDRRRNTPEAVKDLLLEVIQCHAEIFHDKFYFCQMLVEYNIELAERATLSDPGGCPNCIRAARWLRLKNKRRGI